MLIFLPNFVWLLYSEAVFFFLDVFTLVFLEVFMLLVT